MTPETQQVPAPRQERAVYVWRPVEPPPDKPADPHGRAPHAAASCRVDGGRFELRALRYGGSVIVMEGAPPMIAVEARPVASAILAGADAPPPRFPTLPEIQSAVQALGPGYAWAIPIIVGHPTVPPLAPEPGALILLTAVGKVNDADPAHGRPSLVIES